MLSIDTTKPNSQTTVKTYKVLEKRGLLPSSTEFLDVSGV